MKQAKKELKKLNMSYPPRFPLITHYSASISLWHAALIITPESFSK